MSAERKKLLVLSIAGCVFLLLLFAAGYFLFMPKKGGAQAPASVANNAPPKAQDPQDFLSAPPPAPAMEQPKNPDGNVIIVYGDKPNLPATGSSTSSTGVSGQNQISGQGAQSPTPAPSTSPSASGVPAMPIPATTTGTGPTKPSSAKGGSTAAPSASSALPAASATGSAPKSPPGPKAAAKPGSQKPKSAQVAQYWIQAASFSSRGHADDLKESLAEKGIAALITVKDKSGQSWYRVRVGPYSVEAEANGWLAKLKGISGCSGAYISRTEASSRTEAATVPAKP
jgi:cell division protein FtsN